VGFKRVLVTLDGSKLAEAALEELFRVVDDNTHIHLLSVATAERIADAASMRSILSQPMVASAEMWPPIHTAVDPIDIDARRAYLQKICEWLEQADYQVTYEVRTGDVVETVLSTARSGFDLLIMATHGRTGIGKVMLGSVTEGVLHRAPCPVLVIPPSHAAL
jgi:nucleotide-binding universal stress UspA family protein